MENFFGFYQVQFNGNNGVGDIAVTGVKEGDIIIRAYPTDGSDYNGSFKGEIMTDGYVSQRGGGDYSSLMFNALIYRARN